VIRKFIVARLALLFALPPLCNPGRRFAADYHQNRGQASSRPA
jgi:hypothetical protein